MTNFTQQEFLQAIAEGLLTENEIIRISDELQGVDK
jgi:hypothetical protein